MRSSPGQQRGGETNQRQTRGAKKENVLKAWRSCGGGRKSSEEGRESTFTSAPRCSFSNTQLCSSSGPPDGHTHLQNAHLHNEAMLSVLLAVSISGGSGPNDASVQRLCLENNTPFLYYGCFFIFINRTHLSRVIENCKESDLSHQE